MKKASRNIENQIPESELISKELLSLKALYEGCRDRADKLEFDLNERLKELRCQNKISEIIFRHSSSLDEIVKNLIQIIPEAFQYPDKTGVVISIHDIVQQSSNFSKDAPMLVESIFAENAKVGFVKVCCTEKPGPDLPVFLPEEVHLIGSIGMRLSNAVTMIGRETARKKAENVFRSILSASPDVITITDFEGRIVFVSDRAMTMFESSSPDDFLGHHILEYIDPSFHEKASTEIARMLSGELSDATEFIGITRAGRTFNIEVNGEFVKDEAGQKNHMIFVTRDITNRKNAEIAVRASDNLYRSLVNSADAAILVLDPEGRYTYINTIGAERLQLTVENIIGKKVYDIFPKKMADQIMENVDFVLSHNNGRVIEEEIIIAGEKKWYRTSSQPLRNDAGEPFAALLFATDITSRKEAELLIRESEQKYRDLFEMSPDGYLIFQDGIFIECNKASERLVGGTRADIVGKRPDEISPEYQPNGKRSYDYVIEVVKHAFDTGKNEFEWVHKKMNGTEFLALIHLAPIRFDGKEALLVSWKDITEFRQAENEIRKSEEKYRQIFETIRDVNYEADLSGNILEISPSVKILSRGQLSREDLLDRSLFDFYLDYEDRTKFMKKLSEKGNVDDYEVFLKNKDGSVIPVSLSSGFCYDEEGKPYKIAGSVRDITERRKADEELRKFRTITEMANYGVCIATLEGQLIYSNPYWARMHGYEVYELEGRNISMFHNRDQMAEVTASLQILSEQGEFQGIEIGHSRKDGSTFLTLMSALIVYDQEKPLFMSTTAVDITEIKASQKALSESEEKLNYAQEIANMGNWDLDLTTHKMTWSRNFYRLIERKKEEFSATYDNFLKLIHPDDINLHEKALEKIFQDLDPVIIEMRMVMPDKKIKWVTTFIVPEQKEGRLVALYGVDLDITERKIQETEILNLNAQLERRIEERTEQLAKSNEELKARTLELEQFFNVTVDLLCITDTSGNFIKVNKAWEDLLGYSTVDLEKRQIIEFVHPDDIGQTIEAMHTLDAKNFILNFTNRYICKDGTYRSIEWHSINVGSAIFVAARDVSERIKNEEDLRLARNESEKANQAKSEFLSRMSHELRTPMNSILGFAQLLDRGDLNPGQRKGVQHILKSGKHLLDLINEVLDISRIEAGRITFSLEPVQLYELIHEMVEIVQPQVDAKRIQLQVIDSVAMKCCVRSDRQRLKQIILNLVNNAIKYNRDGGSIWISAKIMELDTSGNESIRITVRDSGIGISQGDLSKLFVPFERIGAENTETEGTGLGLAVVKKLLDLMGGLIGVESALGEGSSFWIEFPKTKNHHEQVLIGSVESEMKTVEQPWKGVILYVEDNRPNIDLVQDILETTRPGIRLITTLYGKQAHSLAVENKPDLILLDLNLPDLHGSDVLRTLKTDEMTRNIPVVVITADAVPSRLNLLLKEGAIDYMTKPIDVDGFLAILDKVFAKH